MGVIDTLVTKQTIGMRDQGNDVTALLMPFLMSLPILMTSLTSSIVSLVRVKITVTAIAALMMQIM